MATNRGGPKQQQITKNSRFEKQKISKISHFRKHYISETTTNEKKNKFQKSADLKKLQILKNRYEKFLFYFFGICCCYCNMLSFLNLVLILKSVVFWDLLFLKKVVYWNLLFLKSDVWVQKCHIEKIKKLPEWHFRTHAWNSKGFFFAQKHHFEAIQKWQWENIFITCPRVCQIQDLFRKKYKKGIF